MTATERKANIVAMHYQLKKIWQNVDSLGRKQGFQVDKYFHRELVNNAVWWNSVPWIDVLKYMGGGFRMGSLLSRDT